MTANPTAVKIAGAIAAVVVVAIVGAVVFLGGSDDPDDTIPSPTSQVTPTPAASPTPETTASPGAGTSGPREQAESFALEPVTGVLAFVSLDPGEAVGEDMGVYFMNVETGAVDGWRQFENGTFPDSLGYSGDYRFAGFSHQVRGEPNVQRRYLADRNSGALYTWQGDAEIVYAEGSLRNIRRGEPGWTGEVLTTAADRVLFRIDDPDDDDWFILVSMDPEPAVVTTFQAEGDMALLSTDGRQAVVVGESIWLVDADDGTVRSFDAPIPNIADFDGALVLRDIPGANAFLLSTSATHPERDGSWSRYSWQGEQQKSASGAFRVYPSANGEFVAMAELVPGADGEQWPALVTFNAVSTADGAALFRVVGAIESFGYTTGNIWLADGSGIVLSDPSFEMKVALRDGSFQSYIGMPSPTNASMFAATSPVEGGPSAPILGPTVFDRDGNVLSEMTARARSFVPPWGLTGSEIRFVMPHLGHGGIGSARSLVEPRVDQPPYQGDARLTLADLAVGMDLLDSPTDGAEIGTLSNGVVTVLDEQRVRLEPGTAGYERYCDLLTELAPGFDTGCNGFALWGQWAQVEADGSVPGEEGWVLIAVHWGP